MNRARRRLASGLFAAVLLAAGCGGGGGGFQVGGIGVGSGGTGISGDGVGSGGVGSGGTGATAASASGAVDGFGSIIVGGTRYDTDSALLVINDIPALKLGVTVRVEGTVAPDLATGTATLVVSSADLRGTARLVNPGAGTLEVLSVPVSTDPSTVYAGGLTWLGDLRSGEPVLVHGLPGAGAQLRATRIERLAAAAPPVLTGPVTSLDVRNRAFTIAGQRVSYVNATLAGPWPATGVAEGQRVRVRAPAEAAVLDASSLELASPPAPVEGGKLTVGGVVARYTSLSDLQVDGVPVDASGARFDNSSAGQLVVGARVDVAGTWRSGVLVASRIEVRMSPTAATFSASGPVGAYRSAASFKIKGQDVDAGGAGVVFTGGTRADLGPGRKVLVRGSRVVDDVLIADSVEFLN